MNFTESLWQTIRSIREAIDALPFLLALEDGSLEPATFDHYLAQDAIYLGAYAKVLAGAASRANDPHATAFWSASTANVIAAERKLHASHGARPESIVASPTCTAYTSYLLSLTATASYPAIVAGVLPCFWIYDDVGRRLGQRAGDLSAHPYADWIVTYADPAFAAAAQTARRLVDAAAAESGPAELERMRHAFVAASRYEWMFWDAAWRHEQWPV